LKIGLIGSAGAFWGMSFFETVKAEENTKVVPIGCYKQDPTFSRIDKIEVRFLPDGYNVGLQDLGFESGEIIKVITDQNLIHSLLNLPSRNAWLGYDTKYGGYDVPASEMGWDKMRYEFRLVRKGLPSNSIMFYTDVAGRPGEVYAMPFVNKYLKNSFADSKGKHIGRHPCGVSAIKLEVFAKFLTDLPD